MWGLLVCSGLQPLFKMEFPKTKLLMILHPPPSPIQSLFKDTLYRRNHPAILEFYKMIYKLNFVLKGVHLSNVRFEITVPACPQYLPGVKKVKVENLCTLKKTFLIAFEKWVSFCLGTCGSPKFNVSMFENSPITGFQQENSPITGFQQLLSYNFDGWFWKLKQGCYFIHIHVHVCWVI